MFVDSGIPPLNDWTCVLKRLVPEVSMAQQSESVCVWRPGSELRGQQCCPRKFREDSASQDRWSYLFLNSIFGKAIRLHRYADDW